MIGEGGDEAFMGRLRPQSAGVPKDLPRNVSWGVARSGVLRRGIVFARVPMPVPVIMTVIMIVLVIVVGLGERAAVRAGAAARVGVDQDVGGREHVMDAVLGPDHDDVRLLERQARVEVDVELHHDVGTGDARP
jgi:hypothetical protein